MIQPKIQEVWIPEKYLPTEFDINKSKTGVFFTPEEFETFKKEFGKELLELASENASVLCDNEAFEDGCWVDKESIIETLDEYLLNNKI